MARVFINVFGEPIPQGSKSVTKSGIMFEANKKLKPWREKVKAEAELAMSSLGALPSEKPIRLLVKFYFLRPKSHYRTGKRSLFLRDSSPGYKTSKPDLDKLVRAIGDALTGVVFKDDSQVVCIIAHKSYTTFAERAEIEVQELT